MPNTYYVDSIDGNDSRAGTSEREAWRGQDRLAKIQFVPGDSVLFRRGGVWAAPSNLLQIDSQGEPDAPFTLGAYGAGPRPTFILDAKNQPGQQVGLTFDGGYVVMRSIRVTLANPYRNPAYLAPDGQGSKFGWLVGATISGHHITLDDCEFDHLALGVNLTDASHDCTVTRCHFHDLDALWELGGAPGIMGALGVMLHGTDNVVAANHFERNSVECTIKATGAVVNYGGPVEFFNANRCVFTRNVAVGSSRKHGEMGKDSAHTSADNQYTYNLIVSDRAGARGPNIHGADEFGPVTGTRVLHNTILLTGPDSQALINGHASTAIVDNILWGTAKSIFTNDALTLQRNIYAGGGQVQVKGSVTGLNWRTDPRLDADYRPLVGSPCIGAGWNGGDIGAVAYAVDEVATLKAQVASLMTDLAKSDSVLSSWQLNSVEQKAKITALTTERDALQLTVTAYQSYVDDGLERANGLAAECDALKTDLAGLTGERDRLRDALARVESEATQALHGEPVA